MPVKMAAIDLTDQLMCQFQMFPNFHRPVNNLDKRIRWIKFSPNGEKLAAASNKRTLDLYNCNTGKHEKYFELYKHGISAMDYMDANDTVLIGSVAPKGDYSVRELNMTKSTYDTCYTGHTKPSRSLSVNHEKRYFVSGGFDCSALVFDYRIPNAQIHCSGLSEPPLVAVHPTHDICALALESSRIELYDLRSMNLGPMCIFKLNADNVKWTCLKFSPNGKQLLISSNSSKIRVINSYTGAVQEMFNNRQNTLNIEIDASFTPNSEYILSGSSDGNVLVFNNNKKDQKWIAVADRERKIVELKSQQPEAITAVEMSSKYSLMVTASSYVAFWAPANTVIE